MIKLLSNWIEQIAIAVVIASIFEMILPKGNLSKYIKIVLGIYIVFNIISPFVENNTLYSFSNFDVNSIYKDYDSTNKINNNINQESMDLRLKKLYIEQIEANIKNKLDELGYTAEKCKVQADLDTNSSSAGINKIDLILIEKQNKNDIEKVEVKDITINNIFNFKNNENLKKSNEIKKSLADYYKIDESIINIKIK